MGESARSAAPPSGDGSTLRADCERCVGLCCVAPALSVSADFAIDKGAGQPCPHLRSDFRCSIHDRLHERGFPGCAAYDCFGAGQKVTQVTFAGRDWRRAPELASGMFAAFEVMRQLHELLWYLTEALGLPTAGPLRGELRWLLAETERLTLLGPDELTELDVAGHGREVVVLLRRASGLVRAGAPRRPDLASADLAGRNLAGADLRGADLSRALLIGADLRRADLTAADLMHADLRAADLRGADLGTSIFLTQPQVGSARGDAATRLPARLARPPRWS